MYGTKVYDNIKNYGNVKSFAVSNLEGNRSEIENVPVREITDLLEYRQSAYVVVAVNLDYQLPILRNLKELGFEKVISMYDSFDELMQ